MLKKTLSLMLIMLPIVACGDGLSSLESKLSQLHSLTANFTQTVKNQDGSVLQTSTGNLAVDKPGKFRWQVSQPFPQVIIANNNTVWIYDSGLEQVTIRKLGNSISQTPVLLLSSSNVDLSKEFVVKQQGNTFNLLPKISGQDFKSVTLSFKGNGIDQMQFQTNLGQNTVLNFSDVKLNPNLSASLFAFIPPKGVDVVDQR
jgi:outer membrane lipoprotein carrier protein